jgi:putative lipoprotein
VSAPTDSAVPDTAERPQAWETPWLDARRRGIDIRAIGQEPGWMLEIDLDASMYLLADYGEKKVTTGPPTTVHDALARTVTYEAAAAGHTVTAVVREAVCHDAMSGQRMTLEVRVRLDGQEYRGCGLDLR